MKRRDGKKGETCNISGRFSTAQKLEVSSGHDNYKPGGRMSPIPKDDAKEDRESVFEFLYNNLYCRP